MAKNPGFENIIGIQLPSNAVSFDAEAFDEAILSQGVTFVHYRAMRCPIGLTDPDELRRTHDHHANCSNGFIYTLGGEVTCLFIGNSSGFQFSDPGRYDGSTVTIVLPRQYDNSAQPLDIAPFDRMYLKEEVTPVSTWHVLAAHVTGVDRLLFPAVKVIDLIDSRGRSYKQGEDFAVNKAGNIAWYDGKGPGIDPQTGKGVVYTVRFMYKPYWYVKQLVHEVRVAQTENEFGERTVTRMPQSAVIQREQHFHKEQNDQLAPSPENRQHPAPASGMFGPR